MRQVERQGGREAGREAGGEIKQAGEAKQGHAHTLSFDAPPVNIDRTRAGREQS